MSGERTAEYLYKARLDGTVVDALPEAVKPADIAEAYAAQAALVELLVAGEAGDAVGYKVGCTNQAAMDLLGADGPFFGRLLSGSVYNSGATVNLDKAGSLAVEPEYAYVVGAAMAPRAEPYDGGSVIPYLSAMLPSIELVGGRFSDITAIGVPSLLADNALNAGWVAGAHKTERWHELNIADIEVGLFVDDTRLASGSATNVLGHPLNVVAWLANELNARGSQLEPGDYVTTGTCTAVERVASGSNVRCEFGPLGSVSVQLAA
ncbi:MAG: 2-keto-4-pentenoate hydratase [Gaiellaceae bacterium]